MRNTSIQRFATREQIARIERLAVDLRLDRTDILIDAEEQGAISQCDTYEDLSPDEADRLTAWLRGREARIEKLDAACHQPSIDRAEREWINIQMNLTAKCSEWNKHHPIGAYVTVRTFGGEEMRTRTTSFAMMFRGAAVIAIEGVRGGAVEGLDGFVQLDAVTPNEEGGPACS